MWRASNTLNQKKSHKHNSAANIEGFGTYENLIIESGLKMSTQPDTAMRGSNPSPQETEAGGSRVQGHSETSRRPYLKILKSKTTTTTTQSKILFRTEPLVE